MDIKAMEFNAGDGAKNKARTPNKVVAEERNTEFYKCQYQWNHICTEIARHASLLYCNPLPVQKRRKR